MIRRFMRWWLGGEWRHGFLRDLEFRKHALYLTQVCGYGQPRKVFRWNGRWGCWERRGVLFAAPGNNKSA